MMDQDYVIEANNLACDYSEDSDVTKGIVLAQVKIPRVGVTVIVGPSGSGKSTLLSLLSGIRKPSEQSEGAKLNFYDFEENIELNLLESKSARKAKLGFVFQEPHLIKEISARSNAGIASHLLNRKNNIVDADRLAHDFGVNQVIEQRADTLSGGQAQRIAIVRALTVNPDILVCDEPTSSLDEETGTSLLDSISQWAHENGKAVLWVTHNLQQAAAHSDYLIKVRDGKLDVKDDGAPYDLRDKTYNQKLSILRGADVPLTAKSQTLKAGAIHLNTGKPKQLGSAWVTFKLIIVMEYFYLGNNQNLKRLNLFGLFRKRWWGPLLKSNLIALLALGVLVFSMLVKAQNVGSNYFEEQLSKPELSHFTMAQGNKFPLNLKNTRDLQSKLKLVGNTGEKVVFPRRENYLQKIIPSSVSNCEKLNSSLQKPKVRPMRAPLLIFDHTEPLYNSLVSMVPLEDELTATIFATTDLLSLLSDQKPKYLCLEIDGIYAPFKVLWMDNKIKIPGGSDRAFFTSITEQAFQEEAVKNPQTNIGSMTYSYVAVYFNEQNKNQLMCGVNSAEECPDGKGYPPGTFLVNQDVFKQIDQFSTISYLAQRAILLLVLSFILVMALALGFAMGAEVKAQEKSLAILRAFGVSGAKIASIFQLRTLIQLAYASVIAGAIFWLAKTYLESIIKEQTWTDDIKLTLGFADLIIPIILTLIITQIVTMLVVLIRSKKNRYVAEKLQGL